MTTAPQLSVGTTLQGIDDASFSAFQQLNNPLGAQLITGNIFLGIQGYFAVVIPLGEQLGLCRGGQIETGSINAAVTLTSAGAWSAGGSINVNCVVDDGPRGAVNVDTGLDSRLAWKPPTQFGPNVWRRDQWGAFDTRLEDTGGTPFLDNGPGTYGGWGIRAVSGIRDELAQLFTVPAGPSWSVARAIMDLRRFGNPTGSLEVAIQGSTIDTGGHPTPDGVDVAVSAAVSNSTIPASPGNGPITYAFTPDAVLAPGSYWAVLRPSGTPYVVNGTDFVSWMQRRAFFATGGSHFHSVGGTRFDTSNYPGHADLWVDLSSSMLGPAVVWNPPASAGPGASFPTPDLSSLVQEVILRAGHETVSALCFLFSTAGETRTYRFAAHDHATLNPPGFAAQFRRRDVKGDMI